jgi:hypothetical protein
VLANDVSGNRVDEEGEEGEEGEALPAGWLGPQGDQAAHFPG